MRQPKEYACSKELEAMLRAKMADLQLFCYQNHLPMYATVATGNRDGQTSYVSTIISPRVCERELDQDYICQHPMLHNGFVLSIPHSVQTEYDFVVEDDFK